MTYEQMCTDCGRLSQRMSNKDYICSDCQSPEDIGPNRFAALLTTEGYEIIAIRNDGQLMTKREMGNEIMRQVRDLM